MNIMMGLGQSDAQKKQAEAIKAKEEEADKAEALAEEQVISAGQGLSVINWPDFPRRRLLGKADRASFKRVIGHYLAEHRGAIASTRRRLEQDPKLIYRLDKLMAYSMEQQGITKDSVLGMIIADRTEEETDDSYLVDILEIIALALSFIGGPVGMAAGAVAFGLGVYQAIEEIQEYAEASDAYKAQMLANEPSSTWAVLAVVGVGLDIGGAVRALDTIGTAVKHFNATPVDDLASGLKKLEGELDALEQASKISERLKRSLIRQARAEKQFRESVEMLTANVKAGAGAAELLQDLSIVAYFYAKRGIYDIGHFIANRNVQKFIGTPPDPAKLAAVKQVFKESVRKSRGEGLFDYAKLSGEARKTYSVDDLDEMFADGVLRGGKPATVIEQIEKKAAEVQLLKLRASEAGLQGGMDAEAALAVLEVAKTHGLVIRVRPVEDEVLRLRAQGHPAKPQSLKMKSIKPEDIHLGANEADLGKVAYFEPVKPSQKVLDEMDSDLRERVLRRFDERENEFEILAEKVDKLVKEGSIRREGKLIVDTNTGKAFTGDYDLFDIRVGKRSGEGVEFEALPTKIQDELKASPIEVQHGAHLDWKEIPLDSVDDFVNIVLRARPGGKGKQLLLEFHPDGRIRYTYFDD